MDETLKDSVEFKEKFNAIKEWLTECRNLTYEIEKQNALIDRHKMKMESCGSPVLSDMPKTKGKISDRTSDLVVRLCEMEEELDEIIEQRNCRKNEVKSILKHLKKPDERLVIKMRYIDTMGWDEILDIMFADKDDFLMKEDSYMRRIFGSHRDALVNIILFLDATGKDPRDMI